jgi:hypothetical protein
VIPYAQLGAHAIEVPNADMDAELFLQGRLHGRALGIRGFAR